MYAFCASLSVFLLTPQYSTRLFGISYAPFIFLFLLINLIITKRFYINNFCLFITLLLSINLLINKTLYDTFSTGILSILFYSLYLFISKSKRSELRILLITLTTIGVINFFITAYEVSTNINIFGSSLEEGKRAGFGNRFFFEHIRARGPFGGTITFGIFQFLCLYSAIKLDTNASRISTVLIFISIFFTQSYTALLPAIIYVFRNHLFALFYSSFFLMPFFYDKFSLGSIEIRINNMIEAINAIFSMDLINLLFGYGFGTQRYQNLEKLIPYNLPDYNDFSFYLLMIFEIGITGLLSFGFGIIYFMRKYCYSKNQILVVLLILLTMMTFDYFSYFWIFVILLGFLKNDSIYNKSRNNIKII